MIKYSQYKTLAQIFVYQLLERNQLTLCLEGKHFLIFFPKLRYIIKF